ncbi:MAG: hypothetical protein ABSC93_09025 [Bryobacteraceae bacterium]
MKSLVLLRADPLADIHNTTQIRAVWLEGACFDESSRGRMLQNAKLQAHKH